MCRRTFVPAAIKPTTRNCEGTRVLARAVTKFPKLTTPAGTRKVFGRCGTNSRVPENFHRGAPCPRNFRFWPTARSGGAPLLPPPLFVRDPPLIAAPSINRSRRGRETRDRETGQEKRERKEVGPFDQARERERKKIGKHSRSEAHQDYRVEDDRLLTGEEDCVLIARQLYLSSRREIEGRGRGEKRESLEIGAITRYEINSARRVSGENDNRLCSFYLQIARKSRKAAAADRTPGADIP